MFKYRPLWNRDNKSVQTVDALGLTPSVMSRQSASIQTALDKLFLIYRVIFLMHLLEFRTGMVG